MTDLRSAAQQALEALELVRDADTAGASIGLVMQARAMYEPTITALRAALEQATCKESLQVEQPEQEPVALCDPAEYDDFQGAVSRNRAAANSPKRHAPVTMETVYETIINWDEGGGKRSRRELARRIVSLYTHPPRREWRGLTYQEIDDLQSGMQATFKDICAIEAALKERNA